MVEVLDQERRKNKMITNETNKTEQESGFLFNFSGNDSRLLTKKMIHKIFKNNWLNLSFNPEESDLIQIYLDLERLQLLFKHSKGLVNSSAVYIAELPAELCIDFNKSKKIKNSYEFKKTLEFFTMSIEFQNNFWNTLKSMTDLYGTGTGIRLQFEELPLYPNGIRAALKDNQIMIDYLFGVFKCKISSIGSRIYTMLTDTVAYYFKAFEQICPNKIDELNELRVGYIKQLLQEKFGPNRFDQILCNLYYRFNEKETIRESFEDFLEEFDLKIISVDFITSPHQFAYQCDLFIANTIKEKLLEKIDSGEIECSKKSFPVSIRWINQERFELLLEFMKHKNSKVCLELDSEDEFPYKNGFLNPNSEELDEDEEDKESIPNFDLNNELKFLSRLKQLKELEDKNNAVIIDIEKMISHTEKIIALNS